MKVAGQGCLTSQQVLAGYQPLLTALTKTSKQWAGKQNGKVASAKGKLVIAFPKLYPKAYILSRILAPAALISAVENNSTNYILGQQYIQTRLKNNFSVLYLFYIVSCLGACFYKHDIQFFCFSFSFFCCYLSRLRKIGKHLMSSCFTIFKEVKELSRFGQAWETADISDTTSAFPIK